MNKYRVYFRYPHVSDLITAPTAQDAITIATLNWGEKPTRIILEISTLEKDMKCTHQNRSIEGGCKACGDPSF